MSACEAITRNLPYPADIFYLFGVYWVPCWGFGKASGWPEATEAAIYESADPACEYYRVRVGVLLQIQSEGVGGYSPF